MEVPTSARPAPRRRLNGMRDGEICGLRFSQVRAGVDDDDLGEITVNRSIWEVGSKRARTYRWGHKTQEREVPHHPCQRPRNRDRTRAAGQDARRRQDVARARPEDGYVFSEDLIGEAPSSRRLCRTRSAASRPSRHRLPPPRPAGVSITEMLANKIDVNTVADYHRHQDPALTLRRTPCRAKKPSAEPFSPSGRIRSSRGTAAALMPAPWSDK